MNVILLHRKKTLPCSCSLQFQSAFHVSQHMTALGDASLGIVGMVQVDTVKEKKSIPMLLVVDLESFYYDSTSM